MPIGLDRTEQSQDGARIRVIGIGGGGGNAVNSMISQGLDGVDFIVANTDVQALKCSLAPAKIQVGKETTRGLGAGADPEIGRKSVEENIEEIRQAINGSDMIFITAGMGGGTGTGGAPIVAKIGREAGALVVGVVTKPFLFEARKRMGVAENGIRLLRDHVDALLVIPNQKLIDITDKQTSFKDAYLKVDQVLYNATRGIADIITKPGMVNVDFADVRTIMKGMGDALMGTGVAVGENRALEATENALNSPLLDGITISGAQGVLVNITGPENLGLHEINETISIIEKNAGSDVNLIHGVVLDEGNNDEYMVTVVATGFNKSAKPKKQAETETAAVEKNETHEESDSDRKCPDFIKPPIKIPSNKNSSSNYNQAREKSGMNEERPPKGPSELKEYDLPAVKRKGNINRFSGGEGVFNFHEHEGGRSDNGDNSHSKNVINKVRSHFTGKNEKTNDNEILKEPAFVRNMMD